MHRVAALALIAVALTAAWLPVSADVVERVYAVGLYPHLQRVVTSVTNAIPFALIDVLLIGALASLAFGIRWCWRGARAEGRWRRAGRFGFGLLTAAAGLYLLFLLLWGFNYRRVSMAQRLDLQGTIASSEQVEALGIRAASELNRLHADAHREGWRDDVWRDESLRAAFRSVQRTLSDAPAAQPGRIKRTLLGPYFRWSGVDGMINPFGLEVLANPDLTPWERPFVTAHEWAHLAGYAHEAEANFVGWITCMEGSVTARYSGWMFLYWQVAGEAAPASRARMATELRPGPRADIDAIIDRLRRGEFPLLRRVSWNVYDQYLKANRVESGVRSYSEVVTLILRARFEDGWTPVRRSTSAP
jgi:hypothetical protein